MSVPFSLDIIKHILKYDDTILHIYPELKKQIPWTYSVTKITNIRNKFFIDNVFQNANKLCISGSVTNEELMNAIKKVPNIEKLYMDNLTNITSDIFKNLPYIYSISVSNCNIEDFSDCKANTLVINGEFQEIILENNSFIKILELESVKCSLKNNVINRLELSNSYAHEISHLDHLKCIDINYTVIKVLDLKNSNNLLEMMAYSSDIYDIYINENIERLVLIKLNNGIGLNSYYGNGNGDGFGGLYLLFGIDGIGGLDDVLINLQDLQNLKILTIDSYQNIINICKYEKLDVLTLANCLNLETIHCDLKLSELYVTNCKKINKFPNLDNVNKVHISISRDD